MAAVHHSTLTKEIREKLSLWEGKETCLAPLTEAQKNSVAELTAVSSNRVLPTEVIPKKMFDLTCQSELHEAFILSCFSNIQKRLLLNHSENL